MAADGAKMAAVAQVREAVLFGESVSMMRLGDRGIPAMGDLLYWVRERRNPSVMASLDDGGTASAFRKWMRDTVTDLRTLALGDPAYVEAADRLERAHEVFAAAYALERN